MQVYGQLKSIHTSPREEDGIVSAVTKITIEVSSGSIAVADLHRWVGQDVKATIEPTQLAFADAVIQGAKVKLEAAEKTQKAREEAPA